MDEKSVEIELYEDKMGLCDLLEDMSVRDQARFVKKNEDFEKLSLFQFLRSKHIEPIKSCKGFYEVRYLFSSPPFRGIAIIQKDIAVILLVFKGSGSNKNLEKYLSKAIKRAEDWKIRHI